MTHMPVIYSDNEIAQMLEERKPLPIGWRELASLRPKRGHTEREMEIIGADGGEFRLITRQSMVNPLDFSVILALDYPQSNRSFRLRRHNGKSHDHRNKIEKEVFCDFHIHMATQRYQEIGAREDGYAEVTDRCDNFQGAFDCMLADANIALPYNDQLGLL